MSHVGRRQFLVAAGSAAATVGVCVHPSLGEDGGNGPHVPVRATDTYKNPSINVRDFGARGDGVSDDTEAIREAVRAAFERRRIPQHPEYGYFVSFAEVYLPSGHYRITDAIDVSYVKLRGENYAAVEQMDPNKDLFVAHDAWRQIIEGLTLLGGNVQLNIGNSNIDTGHVTVRDCQFYGSRAAAVQMRKGSNSTFFKVAKRKQLNLLQGRKLCVQGVRAVGCQSLRYGGSPRLLDVNVTADEGQGRHGKPRSDARRESVGGSSQRFGR